MRRVLIVTSSWAPAITADSHRARMLGWALPRLGWAVEVLAPNESLQQNGAVDPASETLFNPDVTATLVQPESPLIFRLLNIRGIGWRSFRPLLRDAVRRLQQKQFDLIYISTTQFNLFCLGNLLNRKTGIPYVLDFHDPWVRESVRHVTTQHTIKFWVSVFLSKLLERYAVMRASGVIAVSSEYIEQLRRRYPKARGLKPHRTAVIPFAAREEDLQTWPLQRANSRLQIAYVGAGGAIMAESFARILSLLKDLKAATPELVGNVNIALYGTQSDWKPGEPCILADIASNYDLSEMVTEVPTRISYSAAMDIAASSDGLLILGVDDAAYVPSKLFTYALTGRPLLACLQTGSQADRYFAELPRLGHLVHFGALSGGADTGDLTMVANFIREVRQRVVHDRRNLLSPYLADAMAKTHSQIFARVIGDAGPADAERSSETSRD